MKMKPSLKLVSMVAIMSALFAAPIVSAQSGSRLCGFIADIPPSTTLSGNMLSFGGKIALLYEYRINDESYRKQCKAATDAFKSSIAADATLKTLTWTEQKGVLCDRVGSEFTSETQPGTDICESMDLKNKYSVLKPYNSPRKTAKATVFTKL